MAASVSGVNASVDMRSAHVEDCICYIVNAEKQLFAQRRRLVRVDQNLQLT